MSMARLTDAPDVILDQLEADGLRRRLAPLDQGGGTVVFRNGRPLANFASNDYLGLSQHPQVIEAMIDGTRRYGAGAAASRLVCGSLRVHHELEEALAEAKGAEAALAFSSGYATAMGCIPAIVGKGDTVILDKLSHACLVDAARLSGATLRVFPHNHMERLKVLLGKTRRANPGGRVLVVTESIFSMDGDLCPLREIVELCEAHGALLWLDEAHAMGVIGPQGLGLAQQADLAGRVPFQMGTLGKALGVAGGYVVASREWIELMVNRARAFIYSTAPPPSLASAAIRAMEISRSAEGDALRATLRKHLDLFDAPDHPSAILPIIFGSNQATMAASEELAELGFLVPAIRFPTVPRGTARLRVSLSAAHDSACVARLRDALRAHRG
jgi:8-amino-7-oxononanoate synthase